MDDFPLTRLLAAGDVDAIVRRFEGLARKVTADLYAPGVDREDFLQEARVGIAKAAHDYKPTPDGSFSGFAYMCARRQAVTLLVATRRRKHGPLAYPIDIYASPDTQEGRRVASLVGGRDPADVVIAREHVERVLSVVRDQMTPVEREALLSYDSSQGSRAANRQGYAAVAARLGVKPKTIDNARQRARKKLELLAA